MIKMMPIGATIYTFQNGYSVSIRIGKYSYSDNYNCVDVGTKYIITSNTAEVEIWDEDENVVTHEFVSPLNGRVAGYVPTETIFDIIEKVRMCKKG